MPINRLAGFDFNPRRWRHAALFNGAESRIDMHLEAACGQAVTWPGGSRTFALGERIHTETSYKYTGAGFADLLAAFTVVPLQNVAGLPERASFAQGACLGIPGITAHRAVHVAGPVAGKTVLVTGAAGVQGQCALQLALHAGARVIAACRASPDVDAALLAGAHAAVLLDDAFAERVRTITPDGVDHIVEVAFVDNAAANATMLAQGGAIASYASGVLQAVIDFWPLLFMNARLFFVGSDDVPADAKQAACVAMNGLFDSGWADPAIAAELPLDRIAEAHQLVEQVGCRGRIVLIDPDGA